MTHQLKEVRAIKMNLIGNYCNVDAGECTHYITFTQLVFHRR